MPGQTSERVIRPAPTVTKPAHSNVYFRIRRTKNAALDPRHRPSVYTHLPTRPLAQKKKLIDLVTSALNHHDTLLLRRLTRFYKTFNVIAALTAGASVGVLSFPEFHPSTSSLARLAEGFLVSSAATAVIAIMLATMGLFCFEDQTQASNRLELASAWIPLVLLDWSIVAFLCGLMAWYAGKNALWRVLLLSANIGVLMLVAMGIAFGMWKVMKTPGGLGVEERTALDMAEAGQAGGPNVDVGRTQFDRKDTDDSGNAVVVQQ
jgi:hypothetical protein